MWRKRRVPEHLNIRRDVHPLENRRLVKDLADPLAVADPGTPDQTMVGFVPADGHADLVGAVAADRVVPDKAPRVRCTNWDIRAGGIIDAEKRPVPVGQILRDAERDARRAAANVRDKRLLIDQEAVNTVAEAREFWSPLRVAPFHHPPLLDAPACQRAAVEIGTALAADGKIKLAIWILHARVSAEPCIRESLRGGLRKRIADETGLRVGGIFIWVERKQVILADRQRQPADQTGKGMRVNERRPREVVARPIVRERD